MRPFSKWTAVRTPPTSRFNLISLGHPTEDDAPPIVSGIEGSFRLSKIAVRKEFRNCSLTVIAASAVGTLLTRRPRVAEESCAGTQVEQTRRTIEANSLRTAKVLPVISMNSLT